MDTHHIYSIYVLCIIYSIYVLFIVYVIFIHIHIYHRHKTKPTPLGGGMVERSLVFIYYVRTKLLICSNTFKLALIAPIISFWESNLNKFKVIKMNFTLSTSTVKTSNILSISNLYYHLCFT